VWANKRGPLPTDVVSQATSKENYVTTKQ
jgi:hypothetical protein